MPDLPGMVALIKTFELEKAPPLSKKYSSFFFHFKVSICYKFLNFRQLLNRMQQEPRIYSL